MRCVLLLLLLLVVAVFVDRAWVATKLTEPARLALSVMITPKIARALGRAPPKAKVAAVAAEVAKQAVAQAKK